MTHRDSVGIYSVYMCVCVLTMCSILRGNAQEGRLLATQTSSQCVCVSVCVCTTSTASDFKVFKYW